MRRRRSQNFRGDEAAARRPPPPPRAPRRGGGAEGARRRGGAAAIPSQTMELPSGTPPPEEPGRGGREGGERRGEEAVEERRGGEREPGRRGGRRFNQLRKVWPQTSPPPRPCPRREGKGCSPPPALTGPTAPPHTHTDFCGKYLLIILEYRVFFSPLGCRQGKIRLYFILCFSFFQTAIIYPPEG